MAEEAQAHDARGLGDRASRRHVLRARLRIPARMVVGEREGASAPHQHNAHHLSYRYTTPTGLAFGDGDGGDHAAHRIARNDEHALVIEVLKKGRGDRRDVPRPPNSTAPEARLS